MKGLMKVFSVGLDILKEWKSKIAKTVYTKESILKKTSKQNYLKKKVWVMGKQEEWFIKGMNGGGL